MENIIGIRGIEKDDDITLVTLKKLPDKPGMAYFVFGMLADEGIDVDIILQSISESQKNDIVFTVKDTDAVHVEKVLNQKLSEIGAENYYIDNDVSKVSVSGMGMKGTPGIAAKVFSALYDAGIEIMHISTSEIKICLLLRTNCAESALKALYDKFDITL